MRFCQVTQNKENVVERSKQSDVKQSEVKSEHSAAKSESKSKSKSKSSPVK